MKNQLKKMRMILLIITVAVSTMILPTQFIQASSTNDISVDNTVLSTIADGTTSVPEFEEANSGAGGFTKPEGNGRIWVDKSVKDNKDGTFEIDLSALTQEYVSTVSSVSTNSTTADVVFVLDGSSSMVDMSGAGNIQDGNNSLQRIQAMIKATNEAIKIIMDANPENRIAVYIYSGIYVHEFLPMNSYFIDNASSAYPNQYIVWGFDYEGGTLNSFNAGRIYFNDDLKDAEGNVISTYPNPSTNNSPSPFFFAASGSATPTQKGVVTAIDEAIKKIEQSTANNIDLKERQPFVFLLSDGGATYGSQFNFNDIDNIKTTEPKIGDGSEQDSDKLAQITASLILSSAYMKDNMTKAYETYNNNFGYQNTEVKFYTVGLGNEINGPYVKDDKGATTNILKYAWAGLNPGYLSDVINGAYLDASWPTGDKDQYRSATQSAAKMVMDYIDQYVDALTSTNPELVKYKNETNYDFSSYYQYADSYAEVKNAFTQLANDVASATKENRQPVIENNINGVNTSIHFKDVLGEGMMVDESKEIILTGVGSNIKGVKDVSASTNDISIYRFTTITGFVSIDKKNATVEWFMSADDLEKCLVKIDTTKPSGYTDPNPLRIGYTVKLKADALASLQNVFYTNAFKGTGANITGGSEVTYFPSNDNTYYFYTNPKTGIIGTLANVGYPDQDMDITHYVKGTTITSFTEGDVLQNVYITTDLVIASQSLSDAEKLKQSDIGTLKDYLPVPADITFQDELKKTMVNCQVAQASDQNSLDAEFAFHNGIQKNHEHEVSKDKNDKNPSESAALVSKEHFENGKITMTLGNNGRIFRSAKIDKTVDKITAVPGDTITYTIKVTNYADSQVTSFQVEDTLPLGLTDITDVSKSGIATFHATGNSVTWSDIKIPAKSSVDLVVTAKVPTNTTTTEYKNIAKITNAGNNDLITPAKSNEVSTTINSNIILNVELDGVAWTSHGKAYKLVNDKGSEYNLNAQVIPDGEYKIYDGSKDTGEKINIVNGSGTKTMQYVTLTLEKGVGIDIVEETSTLSEPGTNANEFIFLIGQTAKISADVKGGYAFLDWKEGSTSVSQDNPASIVMDKKKTLMATSTKTQFKVDITATLDQIPGYDFDGKTVTLVDGAGAVIMDLDNVPNGTYTIYVGGSSTSKTLTVNGADTSLILHYYTLTLTNGNDIEKTSGDGKYLEGSDVFINAFVKTNSGSSFVNWTDDLKNDAEVSKAPTYKITVNDTTHLTAHASPPAKTGVNVFIDVYQDGVIWNGHGKDVYLVDATNNRVLDLTDVQPGTYSIYVDGMDTDRTIEVQNTDVNASIDYYTLTLSAGSGVTSVKETNSQYIFLAGQTANISADVKADYVYSGWSDANNTIISYNTDTSIVMQKKESLLAHGEKTHKVQIQGNLDNQEWKDFDTSRVLVRDGNGNSIALDKVVDGTYYVEVDGNATDISFTVSNADCIVIVDFYTLKLVATDGVNSVYGEGKYVKGTKVEISADIKDGYTFTNWSGDALIDTNHSTIEMNGSKKLNANAQKNKEEPVVPTPTPDDAKYKVDVIVNKDDLTWKGFEGKISLKKEDGTSIKDLTSVPNGKYVVYVDDKSTGKVVEVSNKNTSISLNYYTLNLKKGSGIEKTIGAGVYLEGSIVEINAILKSGHTFSGWSGDMRFDTVNTTITLNGKTTLIANAKVMKTKEVATGDISKKVLPYLYAIAISSMIGFVYISYKIRRQ